MSQQRYQIGQVLFVIPRGHAEIVPVQVVEEITKKKLDGEATSYVVTVGSDRTKTTSLDEIDGEVFDSIERLRKTLIERASAGVNACVKKAADAAESWYPAAKPTQKRPSQLPTKAATKKPNGTIEPPSDRELTVELPDGTRAKIRVPEALEVGESS